VFLDFNRLPKFRTFQMQILAMVPEWAMAYDVPEAEILRQIPWAHGWILSNPRKAPKKDMVRFLFNWMRKSHQMGTLRKHRPPEQLHHAIEPDAPLTQEELLAMHKQTISALKRCPSKGPCELCEQLKSVAA
jgi:hypothetical protein